MTTADLPTLVQRRLEFSGDPLLAIAALASAGLNAEYLCYENGAEWCFASGAQLTIRLDRHGLRMTGLCEAELGWDGAPLAQLGRLLDSLPLADWRAYGWAAFELAYAKDGDLTEIGDQTLLQLVIPSTEVRISDGSALLRSLNPDQLDRIQLALMAPDERRREPAPLDVRRHGSPGYQNAVARAVAEIRAHQLDKVVLSRRVPLDQEIDFVASYVAGRRANEPARSFLMQLDGMAAAGFSPEIVVQVDAAGRVVSQPLAGTRALTANSTLNAALHEELTTDPKEIYEHAISVKTACDELRPICEAGSLVIEEFMTVKHRGTVQHLGSQVAGQLAAGHSCWDAFGAVFPAVTASGVPKPAAYASIRANESGARGLYSGTVLTVDRDGSMDAALVLRALYRQHGVSWLQAGAGIVGQSCPEREFEETCEKLDSVARYLVAAGSPQAADGRCRDA